MVALGGHVLPQELNAHIHQLGGVQGAAAIPGIIGGVGGDAGEGIRHLNAGGVGAYGDLIGVAGVPGQSGVQIPEHPVSGHEGLSGAALLTGAAVEYHRAVEQSCGNGPFDGNGSGQSTRTQQIVAAAVSAASGFQGLGMIQTGGLRQPGQGIKFPQQADDRPAAAEGTGKGSGNAAQILLDGKALGLQDFHIGSRGAMLQHGQLGIAPDPVAEVGDLGSGFFNYPV